HSSELNLGAMNMMISVGGFIMGVGTLIFVYNLLRSVRRGELAGHNPWNAHTLEWATASPPPEHNFGKIPVVHSREPMWDHPDEMIAQAQHVPERPVHMPSPSYWPIFTAIGITLTCALFLTNIWWTPLLGLLWTAIGVISWSFEPAER